MHRVMVIHPMKPDSLALNPFTARCTQMSQAAWLGWGLGCSSSGVRHRVPDARHAGHPIHLVSAGQDPGLPTSQSRLSLSPPTSGDSAHGTEALSRFLAGMLSSLPAACHAEAGLLQIAGNNWTIPSLRVVLLVGMVSSLVPTVLSFLFSDDRSLGAQSEGLLANHRKDQAEAGAGGRLACCRVTMAAPWSWKPGFGLLAPGGLLAASRQKGMARATQGCSSSTLRW